MAKVAVLRACAAATCACDAARARDRCSKHTRCAHYSSIKQHCSAHTRENACASAQPCMTHAHTHTHHRMLAVATLYEQTTFQLSAAVSADCFSGLLHACQENLYVPAARTGSMGLRNQERADIKMSSVHSAVNLCLGDHTRSSLRSRTCCRVSLLHAYIYTYINGQVRPAKNAADAGFLAQVQQSVGCPSPEASTGAKLPRSGCSLATLRPLSLPVLQ